MRRTEPCKTGPKPRRRTNGREGVPRRTAPREQPHVQPTPKGTQSRGPKKDGPKKDGPKKDGPKR